MSDFINPWDLNKNQEEEEVKSKKGWFSDIFDNAEAYAKAAYANTRELGMGQDIKGTFDKMYNREYSDSDEKAQLVSDLQRLQNERNEYRDMFQENQKILNQNDSMLKDFTEVGGTLQGIGTQAKDTAIGFGAGAAVGSVVPVLGTSAGAMAGAKWGNRIGAIHQAINDADMNAIDAWEKVLNEGGTPDQAEQAYKDAFWNNMPTEASDILSSLYFGGKLTNTAGNILNRALGGRLAGAVAKGAQKVSRFDLPARIGTYVANKSGQAWLGQGVGIGLSSIGNGIEERIQEPWQDYATERAVDIQRRQYDPENKLKKDVRDFSVLGEGGLLDYYTTPEGMETGWKAQKMGMLFGGASGLMTKSQFTKMGTAHSDSIQSAKQQAKWIEDNKILEGDNLTRYNEIKETMGNVYDLTDDEKANLSVEDVARMYHDYYTNLFGRGGNRQEQNAVSQADFLNEITGEETARRGLMGDTATKYIDEFGIRPDNETLVGINDNQQELSEEQVQETLNQDEEETTGEETENKEGIKAKASKPDFFDDKTSEQAKEKQASSETQNVIQKTKRGIPDKFGNWRKIEENDDFDHDLNNIGAEAKYENTKTGRIANIKRTKAGYQVTDVTDPKDQGTTRNKKGKKKLLNFLKSSFANQKTKFMSDGTQEQEQVSQALPQEDGVIATKDVTTDENGEQWFNGKKIQSNKAQTIHSMQDLHDYYKTHKDLMSKDLYAEISRQMMRFGIGNANNTEIVLDLTNREAGGFGSETTIRTDPNNENSAVAKAIVRLYAGADLATAAHEMAHLGWMNLSDQDRATFTKWAEKTQGEFIAKILGMDYDQNFRSYLIEALTNRESQTSQDLWVKIKREGAVQQTLGILNGQNYGLAIEERFAWEFSNWYAQGYIKGAKPRNIIERILNKACATLQGALNLLSDTNRYLNGENGYNGGDINNIFTNMSTRGIGQQRQTVAPQEQVETVTRMDYAPEMGYDLAQGLPNVADSELGFNLDEEPEQNLSGNFGTTGINQKTERTAQQKTKTGYGEGVVNNNETLEQYRERMKQEAEQKKEEKKQNYTPTTQYKPKERNRKVGGYEQTSPQGETLEQYKQREAEETEKYKVPTSLKGVRKLLTIVKNRKEGWQRALQSLKQIDPRKFRSIKTQIGNDLWGVSEDYVSDGNDLWGQPQQQSLFGKEFEETKSEPKTQVEETTEETKKTNTVEEPSLFDNIKQETSNKSVEKVNLTSDNQNATMIENQKPTTETKPQTKETTEQTQDNQTESQGETTEQVQEEDEIAKRDREEKEYYSKKEFEYNGQKYKYEPYWMEYSRLENGKEIKIERNSVEYFVVDSMRKMDSPFYKNKPKLQDVLDDLESKVYGANNRLKNTTKTELKKDKELQRLQKEKKELQNNKKNLQKTIDGLKDSTDTSSLEKTMSGIDYDIEVTDGEIYKYLDEIEEMRKDAKEVKQNAPKAIKILKAMYGNKTTNKSQTETIEITKTQDSESENITKTQNVETQGESQTETPVQNSQIEQPVSTKSEPVETKTATKAKPKTKKTTKTVNEDNIENNTKTSPLTEQQNQTNAETKQTTIDKSDKNYQRAVELVIKNRGMSATGLRLTLKDEGIVVGQEKAEQYLVQMENDGIVEHGDEGSLRMLKKNPSTKMQAKGEQNNDSKTIAREEENQRVHQKIVQEQGRDRRVSERDTGLNGQRNVSRSNAQDNALRSKVRKDNSSKNRETSTRFQEAGQNAKNQTLLTPQVEEELENLFWKLIRKKQFHGMDSRWKSGDLDYYKSLSNRRQSKEFNPEFIREDKAYLDAIKNINDYIHEKFPEYKNIYRGVDGHWRFEFSDKDAKFINGFEKLSGKTLETTLEKILKHDNLYKFYDKFKGMPVHLVRNTEMQKFMDDYEHEYYAAYDPETKSIYINSDMFENNDEVRNSLLHEIQHAIQDIEGFANGTSENALNNDYSFSEGEKQAVLTEKRSNMFDEELQQNPRNKTLNTNEKTIIEDQRPVQKVTSTKMQSNGQSNLGYIDKQKDIYSVTFTKSAQQNAENKKKMDFYRKNKSYWRENKDAQTGSITFTRALPYQQHQKTIIYDEINGKKVGKRKKAKWREYYEAFKDHVIKWLFNDKHFLEKAARNVGAIESYMRMMVMKDQGAVAGAAIKDGIVKHNGKNGERTKSLNSIIEAVGEENQTDFLNYCEAYRVLDLEKRNIYQKMTPDNARKEIAKVQRSKNAKLFEQQRQNFVEYNHELLWVLVDGGFITEQQYNKFIENDPNFIPLAKNMDELEGYVDGFKDSKTMINVAHPMHKIGTSMREVANPFLEMQKRTVEYYVKASRNKAGHIFVHDIAEAIAQNAKGDVVAQNQGMVRKLASRDKNGKPISHDNKQYVFYVWENGEKQYYQVADREIYVALKSFDAEQMSALSKIMNATAGKASRLVRNTATMTPDFGLRNLVRDNMEAFISSEHGFLPLVDSLWGMYQMANDTQWFKEYQRMNGEHLSLNRDGEDVATVEHDIKDNVKFYKTIVPLFKKDLHEFMDKDRSMPARAKSLLKLVATDIVPLQSIYKANKRLNDYLETGTRIGEYRNARMGYKGLKGRLFETSGSTIWTTDMDLSKAKNTEMIAAYKSKDITLNFGQHGVLGKELNRYIPFFNASLQGIYKLGNTLDDMIHAEDARRRQELMFKCALMGAMGMAAALAGQGDDDYDEAPDYEHENFWILPNGIRIPKDQLFGKLIGGTVEKATAQYLKDGDVKKLELVQDILGNFAIDKCVPALVDLGWGTIGNYDSFKKKSVTPEYMADKLGYLQKDLSTSKAGADISKAIFDFTKGVFGTPVDVGAKKVDFVISKTLSNLGKYATSLWELTGGNEKMTRGAEVEDKGGFAETSKELPYPLNQIVGTFATNRNSFQSISDFYERHRELKKLSSDESIMSKNEKKAWEAYQAAYKKDKQYRDALKAIKLDKSLTGAQKRQKADKIFKQQISMARKLHDWEKKHGLV